MTEPHSNADPARLARKGKRLAILACILLAGAIVLATWSKFFVWIFSGAAIYTAFLSAYFLALGRNLRRPFRYKPQHAPQSSELKAYIGYHLPIVISLLLGGLLLALIIVFFTR